MLKPLVERLMGDILMNGSDSLHLNLLINFNFTKSKNQTLSAFDIRHRKYMGQPVYFSQGFLSPWREFNGL